MGVLSTPAGFLSSDRNPLPGRESLMGESGWERLPAFYRPQDHVPQKQRESGAKQHVNTNRLYLIFLRRAHRLHQPVKKRLSTPEPVTDVLNKVTYSNQVK